MGTRDHHRERLPIECPDPAKIEYAILPDKLQGVAEDITLSRGRRIRRVEHDGRLRLQKSLRDPFPLVAFKEPVRNPRPHDAVNPSLEDRGRLPPPVWMNDYDSVCRSDFITMHPDFRWQHGVIGNFMRGKKRIKPLGIQIVIRDAMPVPSQPRNRSSGNGMVETVIVRMGQYQGDVHRRKGSRPGRVIVASIFRISVRFPSYSPASASSAASLSPSSNASCMTASFDLISPASRALP